MVCANDIAWFQVSIIYLSTMAIKKVAMGIKFMKMEEYVALVVRSP